MKKNMELNSIIKKIKLSFIVFMISFILILTCACGKGNGSDGNICLTVTSNFGKYVVYEEQVQISGDMSVMDVLKENLEVETAYSGGFVNSINGMKSTFKDKGSSSKMDWFFYVNGFMAQVGADDYFPEDGDHIVWDYHRWSEKAYSNQIIGSFPKCFTRGYEGQSYPLEILYSGGFQMEAENVKKIISEEIDGLEMDKYKFQSISNEKKNTLLIGYYDDFKDSDLLEGMFSSEKGRGIFVRFENESVAVYDSDMKAAGTYESGCIVFFVQKEYPYASGVFGVLGNSEDDIKKAIGMLSKGEFKGKASAFVAGEESFVIPVD